MKKPILAILLCFSILSYCQTNISANNVLVGGGNPWFDVTSGTFGAKCDGVADDTNAINAAISTANTRGAGRVNLPAGKTCVSTSTVSMLQMAGVRLTCGAGVVTFNSSGSCVLKFTGNPAAGRLIDARSSQGIEIDHIQIIYTNTSFAGRVIDFQHSIASDSQNFRVHDVTIMGTSTAKLAICGVCADNADLGRVENTSFFWMVHAIEALNANIFHVQNCNFGSGVPGVGDIGGDYITDLGNNSTIGPNNNFEMSTNNRAINCSTCGDDINIIFDTFNDFSPGYNAQMIVINSNAFNLIGNLVTAGPSAGTFVGSGAAVRGVFIGNTLGSWATCWNFPSSSSSMSLEIYGNKYGTCTTFISLSNPYIGSGRIVDNNGISIESGGLKIGSGGTTINTVLNGSSTLTFTAIAAQTGQEQTLTLTGASTTNFGVNCSPRTTLGNANLSWQSWVSSSNTVSVRVVNPTAGSITPAAVVWGCTEIQ